MRWPKHHLMMLLILFLMTTLAACSGDDGSDGAEGPEGPQGAAGPEGPEGPEGPAGTDGTNGTDGEAGTDGVDGADGVDGTDGVDGVDAVTTGDISGTVTNAASTAAIADVTVSLFPSGMELTTDATGAYSATLPIGFYELTFTADGYETATLTIGVVADGTDTYDIALEPSMAVTPDAGADVTASAASTVTATATATVMDGTTVDSYSWVQVSGVSLTLADTDTDTVSITLPSVETYKEALSHHIASPDRFMVVGIDPFSLEETVIGVLEVTITMSDGSTYTDTVEVHADLNLAWTTGIRTVANELPVLMQAVDAASYSWTISGPTGTTAALDDATSRWPIFTPDLIGTYTLTETVSGDTLDVLVDNWAGGITALDANGRPVMGSCEGCHSSTAMFSDKFDEWRESGHAEIFTQNINDPNGHWSTGCASCHSVGYDVNATNNGADEAIADESWTTPHGDPNNFADMLTNSPNTASMMNIQCENCHGPNGVGSGGTAHTDGIEARSSISSQVCASCHGEPPRHGRYQQWQESRHANFEYTLSEGTVEARGDFAAHCGRCHSGQGYIAWTDGGDLSGYIQGANGNATAAEMTALGMTADMVQPTTCTVCHDPHAQGTGSGEPNTASVRLYNNTGMLPAGFEANFVGNGALCMSCHNTRNGAHNDMIMPTSQSAPHAPSQTDVLMGQNAYFVTPGDRSPHAYIEDTCTNCHMVLTNPPAAFSYNLSGTNHSFEASMEVCANCHGAYDGGTIMDATEAALEGLQHYIAEAVMDELNGGYIWVRAYDANTDLYSSADSTDTNLMVNTTTNPITHVEVVSGHGQVEFHLTFTNTMTVPWTDGSTTTVDNFGAQLQAIFDGDDTTAGAVVWIADSSMFKASWNYLLLTGDKSLGIHNPGFTMDVINATMAVDLSAL